MFVVYAIRSLTTGRIYIGQTKNFEDRLRNHNAGRVQSTKKEAMGAICLTEYGEPKRGNAHGVETQMFKGCPVEMVEETYHFKCYSVF